MCKGIKSCMGLIKYGHRGGPPEGEVVPEMDQRGVPRGRNSQNRREANGTQCENPIQLVVGTEALITVLATHFRMCWKYA